MGLAGVQNDCKTKLIPNIWKNEEKGRGARKALAATGVWVPLCLCALKGGVKRDMQPRPHSTPVQHGKRRLHPH